MSREIDVLVVGLGPAGGSAARQAAAAGLTVLALEKRPRIGEPVQCAELVPGPMAGYAHAPGVRVQRIDGMRSFLPSGHSEWSALPGLMVDRAGFDRALAARAAAAGAEIRAGWRLAALDAARATARIEGPDGAQSLRFRTLIAADGPHSTVARCLGLPPLAVIATRQYTVALTRPHRDTDIYLSDAYPGGYAWLFPKGRVANLGVGAERRGGVAMKRALDALHARLVAEGRIAPAVTSRTGGDIPVGGMRARLVHGTVLFAGDAAGLTHPITGAGIAAAVHSGERAGEAAAEYLARSDAGALAAYEEDMRDQYGPALERALERRAYLARHRRGAGADDDRVQRRGWIAFAEYYSLGEERRPA